MRAFSAACGLWLKGAFISARFYKQKGPEVARPSLRLIKRRLLNRDLLALRRGLLRQRELEHAVAVLRFGLGFVDLLRQREAAAHLAERALGVQDSLVLRHFLLALHFGRQ